MSNVILDLLSSRFAFPCPNSLTLLSFLLTVVICSAILYGLHQRTCRTKLAANYSSSTVLIGLQALSNICIPTCSVWPEYYLNIARLLDHKSRHVRIPYRVLFRDIQQGRIELRNYENILPSLIRGTVVLDGWAIDLDIGLRDRINSLIWTLREELKSISVETMPLPREFSEQEVMKDNVAILAYYWPLRGLECFQEPGCERSSVQDITQRLKPLDRSPESVQPSSDRILFWHPLDTIPSSRTEAYIRHTQKYLHKSTGQYNLSVLSFTTLEISLSPIDRNFVLAAFAFKDYFSKNPICPNSASWYCPRRAAAPLFTSLAQVISLVSSGPHPLRVLRVSNVSELLAKSLHLRATALECNDDARRDFIDACGVQRWREERFSLRWEAGLLRAGILTRWFIIVEVDS